MRKGCKIVLTMTLLASVGSAIAFAQEKKAAADVLPKAAPAQIEALKEQLRRVMVFRDPVTGEFRSPDPGEQTALVGNGFSAARAATPTVGRLPNGAWYLPLDLTKLPLASVEKKADGAVTYHCGAGERPRGGRDEK